MKKSLVVIMGILILSNIFTVLYIQLQAQKEKYDIHITNKIQLNDEFLTGNFRNNWLCDLGCPSNITLKNYTDYIRFTLKAKESINMNGSRSKIYYKEQNLSYGYYAARLSIDRIPKESPVFIGIALWEPNKTWKERNFNEVMIGYYTKNGSTDLRIFSSKNGSYSQIRIYDPEFDLSRLVNNMHTLEFIYTPYEIRGYFDGKFVGRKTDNIPIIPMTYLIGTRVGEYPLLSEDLNMYVNYARIYAKTV